VLRRVEAIHLRRLQPRVEEGCHFLSTL
jgi:hypothetical protein